MKKIASYLLLILPLLTNAGDAGIVKEVRARNLIVEVMVEDPALVQKMTKKYPERLPVYRKNIKESNALLKKVVAKYWKFHKAPLYKSKGQIYAMQEAEKEKKKKLRKNYVVMSMNFFSERVKTREESEVETNQRYTGDANYLYLRFWEGTDIIYTSIPHIIPAESDLVYAVRYLFNQLSGMEFGKDITELCKENAPQMRNKTLLLTKWQASMLRPKDWAKVYPYPHKIVSQAEIDRAIVNADPKYAVIILSDQSDTVVLKTMILADTGQFAGYITDIHRNPITKKELKELVKYSM